MVKTVQKWGSQTFGLLVRFSSNKNLGNLIKFFKKLLFFATFFLNPLLFDILGFENASFCSGVHLNKISTVVQTVMIFLPKPNHRSRMMKRFHTS